MMNYVPPIVQLQGVKVDDDYKPDKKSILEQMEAADEGIDHEDHIKLQEEWMKSIQDKRDSELIEKLIARMKEEDFSRYPEFKVPPQPDIDNLKATIGDGSSSLKTTIGTPDFVKDMYKMPSEPSNPFMQSNIDKKDYKFGGMGKIPRMTQEQREQLLPGDSDYYTTVRALQDDANIRESKIKADLSEFDKTDWQFFKEFVGREWRAVKVLWKRWRNK